MIVKAEGRYLRLAPRKVRLSLELIRSKGVAEAESILLSMNKRANEYLVKIIRSAVANAKVKGFNPAQLYVSEAVCNGGPMWKRFKAAAFGRAEPILKRTAHIRIELDLKPGE
jgi:large subunit ribosomal protein L22